MGFTNVCLAAVLATLFQVSHTYITDETVVSHHHPHVHGDSDHHVSTHSVGIVQDGDWHRRCVGTLISRGYVVTAAQCVDCETVLLILGAFDILSLEKTQIRQSVTRRNIILHPYYDPRTKDNDIAMIRLLYEIILTPFIRPAKLIDSHVLLPPETILYIIGWEHRLKGYSNILSQDRMTLISQDKCRSLWPAARINNHKICAANPQRHSVHNYLGSSCITDPGSPLVMPGHPDTVVAILTGSGKCGSMLPEIFTNIARYRRWIDEILGIRHIEVIEIEVEPVKVEVVEVVEKVEVVEVVEEVKVVDELEEVILSVNDHEDRFEIGY